MKFRKKRLIAALLVLVMIVSTTVLVLASTSNTFDDVHRESWYYGYVENLADQRIVHGYGDGSYGPADYLTRQQAAKMIALAAGLTASPNFKSKFIDIEDADEWALPYIYALEEAEVISGFGDSKHFKPKEPITRGHVAMLLVRAFNLSRGNMEVKLIDIEGDSEQEYIEILASNGIVKGYGVSNEFGSGNYMLRSHFSKMLTLWQASCAVQKAENSDNPEDLRKAKELVNNLPDDQDKDTKAALLARLEKLEEETPTPGTSVPTEPVPDPLEGYVLATDDDFEEATYGGVVYFKYIGTDDYVIVPHVIQGKSITSYHRMFEGSAVKGVASDNPNITDMSYMFGDLTSETLDLSNLDTSSVTTMKFMFGGFNGVKVKVLDLSSFNTSKLETMEGMFYRAKAEKIDLSSFDTSNVTDMSGTFARLSATELDLSNFDTSSVTNMLLMFEQSEVIKLDLSSFDTSSVTDMYGMFTSAKGTEVNLSSFDTSKVTDMRSMFSGSYFEELVLSHFNTSEVISMNNMFHLSKAKKIDVSGFENPKVTDMGNMFLNLTDAEIILTDFKTPNVTSMYQMFSYLKALNLDLSSFDTSNVTNMHYMFAYAKAAELDLSSFDTSKVTDMEHIFQGAETTTGYAGTQADADRFNSSPSKPGTLTFIVKP